MLVGFHGIFSADRIELDTKGINPSHLLSVTVVLSLRKNYSNKGKLLCHLELFLLSAGSIRIPAAAEYVTLGIICDW